MSAETSHAIFTPDVTVAAIVLREGRFLLVEEDVRGTHVLNQPAGHLEPGESLVDAMVRETLEETGWEVRPRHFVGSYLWTSPDDGRSFLRFAFAAEPVRHHPERALDAGIACLHWMEPAELLDPPQPLRSPLVWRAVEDFLGGRRLPLEAVSLVS